MYRRKTMQKKPFGVVGIAKINKTTVDLAFRHNNRLMPVPGSKPIQGTFDIPLVKEKEKFAHARGTLRKLINERLKLLGVKKPRKDSVLAIEVLLSAANGFFSQNQDIEFHPTTNCDRILLKAWLEKCIAFLKEKFGDNLIQASIHVDETTPHIHAFVMPLRFKTVQIPSKSKSLVSRTEWRLCASDFMNKSWYRQMHDHYAKAMNEFGLARGQLHSKSKNVDIRDFVSLDKERKKLEHKLSNLKKIQEELSAENRSLGAKNELLSNEIQSFMQKKNRSIDHIKKINEKKSALDETNQLCLVKVASLRKELDQLQNQRTALEGQNNELLVHQDELVKTIIGEVGEHFAFSRDIARFISQGIQEIATLSELIPLTTEVRILKRKFDEVIEKLNNRQERFMLEQKRNANERNEPHSSITKLVLGGQERSHNDTSKLRKR